MYGYDSTGYRKHSNNAGFGGILSLIAAGALLFSYFILNWADLSAAVTSGLSASERALFQQNARAAGINLTYNGWDLTQIILEITTIEDVLNMPASGGVIDSQQQPQDYLIVTLPIAGGLGVLLGLVGLFNNIKSGWFLVLVAALGALAYQVLDYVRLSDELPSTIDINTLYQLGFWGAAISGVLLVIGSFLAMTKN
ncbi:MAG: hypothetical protein CUN56_04400 [Phototrophicales bacterium]|nr:MAG: hypothetical protein CUN56_04400 [Phototrophicales bacterium]RMG72157.1 MAG: hypothetical protein D6711_13470 [Chloroflexota bacterium]